MEARVLVNAFRHYHSFRHQIRAMTITKKRKLSSFMIESSSISTTHREKSKDKKLVIVLAGPTAVGKSKVAARLCTSDFSRVILEKYAENNTSKMENVYELGTTRGHIVSADSVQVYEGLQIGANKPTTKEREETPHHLIDIVDGTSICQYNAADWMEDALYVLDHLTNNHYSNLSDDIGANRDIKYKSWVARKKRIDTFMSKCNSDETQILPVIVGGTMMYLQWLIYGRPDAMKPSEDAILKAAAVVADFQGKEEGWKEAADYAASISPLFAERVSKLAANDWYRLRRTLEVAYTAFSDLEDEETLKKLYNGQREGGLDNNPDYDVRCFFLCPDDRMAHTAVVDSRCEDMLINGLLRETAELSIKGLLPEEGQQARAIGYRQSLEYLKREDFKPLDSKAFENFLASFTTSTRQYAKKQMQWFRKDEKFTFIPVDVSAANRIDKAANLIQTFCSFPRSHFDQLLNESYPYSDTDVQSIQSLSKMMKTQNENQGKKMKFYKSKRHTLIEGSDAFERILIDADSCVELLKSAESDAQQNLT